MARMPPFPPAGSDDHPADNLPIPDWHLQIVEERLAAHRDHPEQVIAWEEAEKEILSQLLDRTPF